MPYSSDPELHGVSTGSFSAPDHEYPVQIQITLTVTDAGGLQDTQTIILDPTTVDLTFQTTPTGLQLVVGTEPGTAPFTDTVIVGSINAVNAPSPQTQGATTYYFSSWSDGGAQTHSITAGTTPATYTATYVTGPDTTPPSAPGTLTATAVSGTQINLSWGPATDNVGVTGYRVERCQGTGCTNFAQIATPAGTTYNDNTGLVPGTTYRYQVRAADGAGNLGPYSNVASATTLATIPGLVAAYSFNEGLGSTVSDASGNGNAGNLTGATWTTAGRYGNALQFNGSGALVTINDSTSLNLTTGMTLEAWVYPTVSGGGWKDVIYKGTNDIYYLEGSSDNGGVPAMGGTFSPSPLYGTAGLPVNTWSHLAATYDGATMRLYVNGVQVASRAQTGPIQTSTGPLTIGGDALYGQYWAGRIDEVRIYNRALSAG